MSSVVACCYFAWDEQHPYPWQMTRTAPRLLDERRSSGRLGMRVTDTVHPVAETQYMDLDAANEAIRQDAHNLLFSGNDSVQGCIDVARVASNCPVEDHWDTSQAADNDGGSIVYAGVYDGHAGWATSRYLAGRLISAVSSAWEALPKDSSTLEKQEMIKETFRNVDAHIMQRAMEVVEKSPAGASAALQALEPVLSGSCALLTAYDVRSGLLYTAVTGDSRAVLGKGSPDGTHEAIALSKDQTGFNEDEVKRLNEAHPGEEKDMINPRSGRLFGMAITRAFGDHRWKYTLDFLHRLKADFFDVGPRPNYKTPPYMTAEPEVTVQKVHTGDFVVLASDGLWDHMSNEDAVECVSQWLAAKRSGKTPVVTEEKNVCLTVDKEGYGTWEATKENFAIEDMDNAAVCLIKNAFGGNRRDLFKGVISQQAPRSRYVRDDVTVQVIFTKDPYEAK